MKEATIPGAFRESVGRYRKLTAFSTYDGAWKTMTYGEFSCLAESMASFLVGSGLAKGQRVAIVGENRPEWCAVYMAIQFAGGIAVPIDMLLGVGEIRNLLLDSEAWGVCYTAQTEVNVTTAMEGAGIRGIKIDTFFRHEEKFSSFPEIVPDDIASIIYTSGTTGDPKGVMLTHRNLCADARAVMEAGIVTHEDNVLSILPLHHTYPFMCTFLVPAFLGAAITFAPALKAAEMISAIRERGVTILVAVPRVLEMMRDGIMTKIRAHSFSGLLTGLMRVSGFVRRRFGLNPGKIIFSSVQKNFGGLRFFTSGGAKLDPVVMTEMEALGFTLLEGYGLTETSPVITFNPPKKRKAGSAGRPLPGAEIRIGDDGEVMVKGPMVTPGYYKKPEITKDSFSRGWFLTGDLGYMDKEGYLYVTGRKKEVIILSSGKSIYPEDVEKAYSAVPLIKEICVTLQEKDGVAESLYGIIVPDMDHARTALVGNIAESLKWEISSISQGLPEYMRIKGFNLRTEPLPRTPLGKLRRFMVKTEVARPEKERPADPLLIGDELGRKVLGCIYAVMKKEVAVHASDSLEFELGFDSLRRLEFLTALEDAFSITLHEQFIAEVQTVGDVLTGLKAYLRGGGGDGTVRTTWADILARPPEETDRERIPLSPGLPARSLAYALYFAQKAFMEIFFRLETEGRENLPASGPYILAPNHTSYLDGFVIAASVPLKTFEALYFIGAQQYFAGVLGSWAAFLSHVIPIDPETYLQKALQMSSFVLRQGKAMCIFPEGGRSFDNTLMPFKKGIGILALELQAPVIPVFIDGAFQSLPKGAKCLRPAKIRVRFGKPLSGGVIAEGEDRYQAFADRLRDEVLRLSQPVCKGV